MSQVIGKDYADRILQEAKDYYHKIKSLYDKTNYHQSYKVGHMWGGGSQNQRDMVSVIESNTNALESIRFVDKTIMYSINPSSSIKEKMVDWYIDYLKRDHNDVFRLDDTFQESSITNPAVCVQRGGRLLTPDFLRTVILSSEIRKYCKVAKPKWHIIELGGGCGHLARTLKLFMPNSVYVDIDIPETLYFSYIFLKLNFPEAKTCYVTDLYQLDSGIDQYDFVFIPTKFVGAIIAYEFDLFINTASLGEMSNTNIRYWMGFVQGRLRVKYFFGLNRFLNTIPLLVNQELKRINENEGSVLFDDRWNILRWELAPQFARCPYEELSNTNQHLEVIAERLPSVNKRDNQLRSQQIIAELMDEDWVRCRERFLESSMRKPQLANDLTMNGTLFKLWESICLHPEKDNVAMMLMYLFTLTKKGYPFEEWFYYKNLLKSLGGKDLSLSVSYNPFNIRLLYHYIMGFLPYRIRMFLIALIGRVYMVTSWRK